MNATKKPTPTLAIQDLQFAKHTIIQEMAATMVRNYKGLRNKPLKLKKPGGPLPADTPSLPICLTYNKAAIYKLMKTPGCAGICIYPAINSKQQLTLVIVGVDEKGENILDSKNKIGAALLKAAGVGGSTGLLDEGQASPPYPAPGNGF